ncbi:MAG: DUF5320 domain-containing protein [Lawsonibacter sp.]
MPNMDGAGPRFAGERNGFGFGQSYGARRRAAGFKRGRGYGMGFCRLTALDSKESLLAAKTVLQQRLAVIEQRLQEH